MKSILAIYIKSFFQAHNIVVIDALSNHKTYPFSSPRPPSIYDLRIGHRLDKSPLFISYCDVTSYNISTKESSI